MLLKKIPNEVQCLLNASARIHNFKQAIEELVYNSLDAESSSIAIRVHIQKNWMQVVDNGIGIKNSDFNLLGERYATSKLFDVDSLKSAPSKYGYRGQALANIIEMSQTVNITSKHMSSDETWAKTFSGGKEHKCHETVNRPSKGTTVEIIGFLFNHKIQRQSINPLNEVQEVKLFLQQLSLIFNNISITLRDDSENEIIFKIHKNRDIYQTLKSLFDITTADVKEFQVEKSEYKVKAYIGKNEHEEKKLQWIYLNNKFINNNCNFHKLINMKLSNTKGSGETKIKISKNKAIYNEENQVKCRSDELYFLFISCPYYDYDIVYSGRQATVEFKDWEQINKLIDKLVKFYKNDLNNMINMQKKNIAKNVAAQNTLDTRTEVKKIMEKILGKDNKKSKISQVQRGIKGKLLKRKKKKGPLKNAFKKATHPHTSLYLTSNDRSHENKVITKSPLKIYESETQLKSSNHKNKNEFKYKAKKKSKYLNDMIKSKRDANCDKLLEIFKNYSNTTKRRCNELSNYINNVININNYNNTEDKSFNQFVNTMRATENLEEKSRLTSRKVERTFKDSQLPKHPDVKYFTNNKKTTIKEITSYDLLQTILTTQGGYSKKELVKKDSQLNIQKSNIYETRSTSNGTLKAAVTFQSHKYSMQDTLQHKQTNGIKAHKFIRPQSRKKLIFHKNNNSNLRTLMKKNSYNQCLVNTKKYESNSYNRVIHEYKNSLLDKAFSIDISKSDIIEFSKKIRNQIINDMNCLSSTDNYNKLKCRPQCTEKVNYEINFNIESTYTILQNSIQDNPQMLSRNDSSINETIMEDCHIHFSHYDKSVTETKDNANKSNSIRNNLNVIFLSKPQETNSKNELIQPSEICAVIINDSNEVEEEINNNIIKELDAYNDKNYLPRIEKPEDSNIDTLKNFDPYSRIIQSQNTNSCYEENFHISSNTVNLFGTEINSANKDEEKNMGHIMDPEKHINSISNFNILTRRRFMPKGMSPIFKNCFSKNICSYNLDAEYYDDVIYDKFFEDVAENTEMYEPHVQTTKEIVTRPIKKVTDNIKKDNASLIFGTESLVAAQVVLGQVDGKFIAAKIRGKSQTHDPSEFFVLFDQHAVHERIRLEDNLSYYFNGDAWKNVSIDAITLKLSRDEIIYLHNHKDKFIQFGLEWTVLNDSEILLNSIPKAILGKNQRPMETIIKSVKNLFSEQVHAIKHLKGNINLYPRSIMNLLFSEACRYAIMFGDLLSKNDCKELIAALASCKTPFQCAHGRPVMAVMMEWKCDTNDYKINAQNLYRFKNKM